MDIQSNAMQHQNDPGTHAGQPRDLTWLGLADDRELLCLAREIAANNQYVSQATNAFGRMATKLHCGRLVQG